VISVSSERPSPIKYSILGCGRNGCVWKLGANRGGQEILPRAAANRANID
jgi:hypothetical protein